MYKLVVYYYFVVFIINGLRSYVLYSYIIDYIHVNVYCIEYSSVYSVPDRPSYTTL